MLTTSACGEIIYVNLALLSSTKVYAVKCIGQAWDLFKSRWKGIKKASLRRFLITGFPV